MVMYYLVPGFPRDRIDFIDRFGLTSRRLMKRSPRRNRPPARTRTVCG